MSQVAEIGHNSGETELSQFEKYQARSKELVSGADRFADQVKDGIQDDAMAEKAANFRLQIKGAINIFGKARVADKKPHLEAGKQVDADYKAITTPLEGAIEIIDKPLLAYAQKKEVVRQSELKAQREEQERLEREAEAAAAKAEETNKLADKTEAVAKIDQFTAATEAVEKTEAAKPAFGKSPVNGRATGVRMVSVIGAQIIDSKKAAALFHSHPDAIAAIEKIATGLFKKDAELTLDGVARTNTQKMR